jgi:Flp pilus assembly pilin Flp
VIVPLKDKRRRKIRRLVTIITILLVIAATVAACLTVEALRDQVNSLFERLGNALRGVSPF